MDSRPSSSSVAKSPVLLGTSASASIHNRLSVSSSSSQRRLRALAKSDSDELPQRDRLKSPAILRSLPSSPQTPSLPLYNPDKAGSPKTHSVAIWFLVAYCLLSVAFFTARFLNIPELFSSQKSYKYVSSISPINEFPVQYRLSRLMQTETRPVSLSPFISSARLSYHNTDITACIWIRAEDVKNLESWSFTWDGPMSVVVVVSSASPHQTQKLLKDIEKPPTLKEKVDFHVIQRMPNETHGANSYLNLARLFAQTRFVALFPEAPLSPIPPTLLRRLSMQAARSNASRLASPLVLAPSKLRPNSPVPFPPLSPLLVEQAYPIWCSERFFTAPSREDDWEECLWQFWLNSYGRLSTLAGSGWKDPSIRKKSDGAPLASEELIHRRLSNRFRRESCVLAAKRLKDRSTIPGKVDPRKAQWLRKTCRQVMNTWGKELF